MPTPSDPTATTTTTWALNCMGQYAPSNSTIAEIIRDGLPQVLSEMAEASREEWLIATETAIILSTGNSVVALPANFGYEQEVRIYWANDDGRGTVAGSTSSSITLAAGAPGSDQAITGLYAFILQGTGATQYRQVTNYDGTTLVASLAVAFATNVDSTSTYLIGQHVYSVTRKDLVASTRAYVPWTSAYRQLPSTYEVIGRTFRLHPAPDKDYPLVLEYIPQLTRLDVVSTDFVRLLRERYNTIVQGLRAFIADRFDDERAPAEKAKWEEVKAKYANQNKILERVPFVR